MSKRNTTPKATKAKTTKAKATKAKAKVVNADAMAKAVATSSGNDYQQYIRALFKDRLSR